MVNSIAKLKDLTANEDPSVADLSQIASVGDPSVIADWPSDPTVMTFAAYVPLGQSAPAGNQDQKPESPSASAVAGQQPQAAVILNATNQVLSAAGGGLAFQNSYGLDSTFNTLTPTEQAAFQADILQAEANLSRQFTNSLTANVDFEAVNIAQAEGGDFNAANQASAYEIVSYPLYLGALQTIATSSYQLSAVAAINKLTGLGQNPEVELPIAYARMLGLDNSGTRVPVSSVTLGFTQYPLSSSVDDTVFINLALLGPTLDNQSGNTPNDGIVGVLEHELTELIMGRTGALQQQGANLWAPTDFFRVNSTGQSYLTPSQNGTAATAVYFSPAPGVTGPVSSLQFNNTVGNGDFADWIGGSTSTSDPNLSDPFGPGDFSNPTFTPMSSVLSPTDIDLLNVLGWTLASSGGTAPPLSIAIKNDTGASSTDQLTSNATLTGVAASNGTVALTLNGTSLGTATADAGGGWTFKPTLADGQYTIVASESYGTGQTVTVSTTFTLATKAPTINASESVSGQTSQTSDTITASAIAESMGANAIVGVEIFDGNSDLGAANLSNGSWMFTALNLLPGAHNFTAKATDTAGNAASFSLPQVTVSGSQPIGRYTLADFSFTGTGITDIRPKGINDSGEIVGFLIDARPDDIGADGQTYFEHAFYSTQSNGVRQYLPIDNPDAAFDSAVGETQSLDRTRAFAVNNNGDIVGWYSQDQTTVADNGTQYVLPDAGYIMSANWPGTFGTLGFSAFGDFGTHALGINSTDQIVGYYLDASGEEHGFLRGFTGYGNRGNYVSLDPTGSVNTVAEGINDNGEVVGFYQTADLFFHGFYYNTTTGVYSPIDVNGATGTEALGVNNAGQIVGEYFDGAGNRHGFLRSSAGQVTTIDDPNAGASGTLVGGINNAGEIVGWYTGTDGHDHGFTGVAAAVPTVVSITASPSTGDVTTGAVVALTVTMNSAVTVSGGTLALNDGGTASYVSGSGTSSLVFNYTVVAAQSTAALAVTGFNSNGATVQDTSGNNADLSGAQATFGNLQVNISGPIILQPGPSASHDIWTTDTYSFAPGGGGPGGGLADDQLRVGGWGDSYYSLLQFDLTGQPTTASSVKLVLYDGDAAGGSPTGIYLNQVTSPWNWQTSGTGADHNRLWWADKPTTTRVGTDPLPAPSINSFYAIDITNLYNAWQSGTAANYGVELQPVATNNNFDMFASSRAAIASERPQLVIQSAAAQTVVIEALGATKLVQVGNQYFLQNSGGTGPVLQIGGTAVVSGQYGTWAPIGAEANVGGYEIAWRNGTGPTAQYTVWETNSSGPIPAASWGSWRPRIPPWKPSSPASSRTSTATESSVRTPPTSSKWMVRRPSARSGPPMSC